MISLKYKIALSLVSYMGGCGRAEDAAEAVMDVLREEGIYKDGTDLNV